MRGRNCRARSSSQTPFSPGIRWSVISRPISSACSSSSLKPVLGVGRGQDAEFVAERAREILQRFLLVVHVEDGEFFIVVQILHDRVLSWHRRLAFDGKFERKFAEFSRARFCTEIFPPYSCTMR